MEERIDEIAERVGAQHGFQCFVIATSDGRVRHGGDCESLHWTSLVSTLFGGRNEVIALFDFLRDKLIPQIYQQGEVFCMLVQVTQDIVIGFFAQDDRDAVSLYKEGKEISANIKSSLTL